MSRQNRRASRSANLNSSSQPLFVKAIVWTSIVLLVVSLFAIMLTGTSSSVTY